MVQRKNGNLFEKLTREPISERLKMYSDIPFLILSPTRMTNCHSNLWVWQLYFLGNLNKLVWTKAILIPTISLKTRSMLRAMPWIFMQSLNWRNSTFKHYPSG